MIKNKFSINTNFLNNKSILVTGGTGSFGNAFVKKLLIKTKLRRLVILSRDEYKQYTMKNEVTKYDKSNILRFFIGDVRDTERLNMAFRGVDYIVHAAALKQITTAEYNPFECIHTNVLGAQNIVKASLNCRIKKVISLSTDKAANPINLYGASKLAADKLFISANQLAGSQDTNFSIVRYGNVINSRGSVIPFFLEKIKAKEKYLPITHPEMTRFFLTIEQGVNFVLDSLVRMQGGEIFVPKCPSIKITELAKMLKKNVLFKTIGLRPGEKIHEVLCPKEDSENTIEFKNFYTIKPTINFGKKKNYLVLSKKEKGRLVSKNFEYSSDKNINKISKNIIKNLIEKKS